MIEEAIAAGLGLAVAGGIAVSTINAVADVSTAAINASAKKSSRSAPKGRKPQSVSKNLDAKYRNMIWG